MPALPALDATIVSVIRDDLRLTTWILLGACVQALFVLLLPGKLVLLPAVLLLGFRVAKVVLMLGGIVHDTSRDKVLQERLTARLPYASQVEDGGSSAKEEMVLFIIGARSNHPLSRFAPGFLQAGEHFQSMWKEAEANRAESGYLGRSSDMLATDDETANAIITLSYWRSMAHLQAFANGPAHRAGWDWFNRTIKTHPHLSMMHEVYALPKGHWENIYKNFAPFGMGQTKFLAEKGGDGLGGAETLVSPFVTASGPRWASMKSRMGWVGEI